MKWRLIVLSHPFVVMNAGCAGALSLAACSSITALQWDMHGEIQMRSIKQDQTRLLAWKSTTLIFVAAILGWSWMKFINLVLELEQGWHRSALFHGLPSFDVDFFVFFLAMPKKPVLVTIEEFEELKKQLEVRNKLAIFGIFFWGGSSNGGTPKWVVYSGKCHHYIKWMITRGTPILGNLHIYNEE